jgi:hypothetical protein
MDIPSEKPLLTVYNIEDLVKEERKKIVKINVSTPRKRQEAFNHFRSLSWFHLLRGNVVKALAQTQACIDIRTKRDPDSDCLFAGGRVPFFKYESPQDRAIRILEKEFEDGDKVIDG